MSEVVKCTFEGCEKTAIGVEEGWLCSKHRAENIKNENSFPFVLLQKIDECVDIERTQRETINGKPPGIFMLRELAQNADDCEAEILVLEFRSDGLYIYNDGRAFTQKDKNGESPDDFNRLVNILTRPKALDPDTTGSYGSGFQTVYYVTNTPEVHSYSNYLRYDPTKKEDHMVSSCENEMSIDSPYINNGKTYGGTVFRLPWRQEYDSALNLDESKIDVSNFAKWDEKSIRFMFEQFKSYSHDLILCANNLKTFRILWNFKDNVYQSNNLKGYQVQKGELDGLWDIGYIYNDGKILNLIEGLGCGGYLLEQWNYENRNISEYLICSDFVRKNDYVEFITKPKGQNYTINYCEIPSDDYVEERRRYEECKRRVKAVKRSEIHVLIPLQRRSNGVFPPTYCTIPFAKKSGNNFIISGPFFSKENRIEMKFHTEAEGEWFRDVLEQIVRLYIRAYRLFIHEMEKRYESSSVDEYVLNDLIVSNLPSEKIDDWVGAEGVIETVTEDFLNNIQDLLYKGVFCERIYFHEGELLKLISVNGERISNFTDQYYMSSLLRRMGFLVIDELFFQHDRFKYKGLQKFVDRLKNDLSISEEDFIKLYYCFIGEVDNEHEIDENKKKSISEACAINSIYGKGKMDFDFISDLINYWLKESKDENKDCLPIFANKKNNLVSANQLLRAPSGKFFKLEEILPDNKTLHTDFIENSQLLEKIKEIERTKQGIEDLLKGIDEHHSELEDKDTDQLINIIILAYEWIKETGVDLTEVTSEMESDIKIILNHNCNLVPLNCVAWMPYKHYEVISTLLSDSLWLDYLLNGTLLEKFEDLFKKHLNWVGYPRIINEFADKIQGEDTVYRKRQKIIVEGILEGLIENQWKKEDITNLAFLPVSGTLVEPDKACLGTVFDADIRDFLGVVDDEIQEVINLYAGGKQIMLDAGMHDINDFSMKVKWICNRIHELSKSATYDSNSNRELSEEEHLQIINCLSMIDWKTIKDRNKDINLYEKNILPLRLNERIFLGAAPYSLKNVETKRLKEIYKRDYPFAPLPSESINEVHHLIQQSVRVLDLQNNNQLEIDISKTLNLLPLIDKSGQGKRRLFLMHFVIPSKGGAEDDEPSLFFDEVLEDFICKPLRKDEIEKIKKSLLPMVMELYEGTEHSGGDYEASNKPCLCREKNGVLEWYRPIDAVIGLKEDIPILKIKRPDIETLKKFVSDDFDIEGALSKIGVPNDVSFEKIKEAIDRTLNSEDKIDKKTLLDILHFSLSKNIGKKENWEGIEWIPVCDGPFINAEHVLAPTAKIKKILGEYYVDSLLDIDDLEFDFEDNVYLNMGMRTTMDFEEIIDLWNKKQQSSDTDSGCLFKEIKEKIDDIPTAELKELKYFYKGKWYVPRNVYLIEPNSVPEILKKNNCLFLGENYPDHLIIKKLREAWEVGEPILSADNILKECVHVQDMETLEELWKYLIQNKSIIEPTHKEKYGGEKIFPCDGSRYAPENVLIHSRSGKNLKFIGKLNDVYILDNEQISGEIDTLLMLRASEVAEVLNDIPKLQNILMHITEEKPEYGSDLWSDFVTLISIFMEKDATLPDFNIIPIYDGHGIDYELPKNVVIKDENDIWTLFKDEQRLNFFDPEIFSDDDIAIGHLIQWFKCCGANDFKELLEIEEPTKTDAECKLNLTKKIRMVIQDFVETGITEFTSSDKLKIIQHINDLIGDDITRFSIYSCEHITRQYCIDMGTIDGGTSISKKVSANHHFDRSTSTLFILRGFEDPNLIKEFVKMEFNPGFDDPYRKVFWENAVEFAFNEDYDTVSPQTGHRTRETPDFRSNLEILDRWWGEYNSKNTNRLSFPTLDGDFWWPALGLDDQGNESKRDSLLKERLFNDRKLMFNIFAMATFLGANVGRTHIKNYINLLDSKGLSFCKIYDMEEENAIREMIDDILKNVDSGSLQEKHYPNLRRRLFDILLLRRAMKDEYIGENIIEMLKIHMEDGLSPENFLTSGQGYGNRPFMKGFKGMFTGQIYFIIRETVRLGLAKNWKAIAFHAPSQVRTLIEDLGGDVPQLSNEGWREDLAISLIDEIGGYKNLNGWYDIPFFMYYDEFCRNCKGAGIGSYKDCKMNCYRRWWY